MDGVTVISENTYHHIPIAIAILIIIMFIITFALLCYIVCDKQNKLRPQMFWRIMIILTGLMLTSLAISTVMRDYQSIYTEYTVKVDNSVSINEFLDKYDIVSRNGTEYIIRERTDINERSNNT